MSTKPSRSKLHTAAEHAGLIDGNRIISGTWDYVSFPSVPGKHLRFVVSYIDSKGASRKAHAKSSFSSAIKDAILSGGDVHVSQNSKG
jgi:hypothetical protein